MSLFTSDTVSTRAIAARAFTLAAGALLLAATSGPAAASVISHSIGFSIDSHVRGSDPRLAFHADLPLFDPTLGTLNQVDIIYRFDLELDISITNRTLNATAANIGPTSLQIEGPRFFDRFSFNNVVASTTIDETINVAAGTQRQFGSISLVLPARASTTVDLDRTFSRTSRPLQIRNIVLRPQGNVTPFVGVGEMLLDFTALTTSSLNLPQSGSVLSGISSSTSFTLGGSVDVTYDFTAAPAAAASAPATLLLALFGMFGARLLGRRRHLPA